MCANLIRYALQKVFLEIVSWGHGDQHVLAYVRYHWMPMPGYPCIEIAEGKHQNVACGAAN